jgi:hypothetical protein
LINCEYSIIEIYHKYKNGTPISEIVKKTGISRKTWNKRFERLEKKNREATNNSAELINKNNNYSELIIRENDENNSGDNLAIINTNGDKWAINNREMVENVSTTDSFDTKADCETIIQGKNEKVNSLLFLFIILFLICLSPLFQWLYEKYGKRKLCEE